MIDPSRATGQTWTNQRTIQPATGAPIKNQRHFSKPTFNAEELVSVYAHLLQLALVCAAVFTRSVVSSNLHFEEVFVELGDVRWVFCGFANRKNVLFFLEGLQLFCLWNNNLTEYNRSKTDRNKKYSVVYDNRAFRTKAISVLKLL